jgi:hypothetical protein
MVDFTIRKVDFTATYGGVAMSAEEQPTAEAVPEPVTVATVTLTLKSDGTVTLDTELDKLDAMKVTKLMYDHLVKCPIAAPTTRGE